MRIKQPAPMILESEDPPVPFTIIKVPNNSPAYVYWNTLTKFKSTFQPRASTIQHGEKGNPGPGEMIALLPYLYNDLGVMIFDGPDEAQIRDIGDVLKQMVGHDPRLQLQDWSKRRSEPLRFSDWNVYRLQLDEKTHITSRRGVRKDPGPCEAGDNNKHMQREYLNPRGLSALSEMALDKWKSQGKWGRSIPFEVESGSKFRNMTKKLSGLEQEIWSKQRRKREEEKIKEREARRDRKRSRKDERMKAKKEETRARVARERAQKAAEMKTLEKGMQAEETLGVGGE
ncbi:hypothetical protein F53441_5841 [Fusarium austroafricanum]|uniref:Uncharacterized protein n=1 Tax=Fusarium austroafricanum TaxID=2364996 RepID=A0A8H4P7T1_9HYPO|nr:hypothetical protein F53441_5841 [Fusarium austroafricanum]